MKVKVNSITGFEDAFVAMYISKRTWTPELDTEIRSVCSKVLDARGNINNRDVESLKKFNNWLSMLLRMGKKHITVLRFIDISIMTEGLHRAGQDDVDSHARRFDNRIIRSSTRLATFSDDEMSDFYKDKVLTTNKALNILGIDIPDSFEYEGTKYVKSPNGYVKEEYENSKDVKRGLYMLSIPSNFVSKINLCEWGHVFQQRNKDGGANPEVKEWAEEVMKQINKIYNQITRDYVLSIEN
ncbi:MAG: hypothetical protein HDQ99_03105 [Lachnospiraceae bacterium]|nr:hypothetical protein [Lachnospiraceae bacterium]